MKSSATNGEVLAKIQKALAMVHALCQGARTWTMSVPAQPDHDPDLVIAAGLEAARSALCAVSETGDRAIVAAAKRWRSASLEWDKASEHLDGDDGHGGSPLEGFEEELRGAELALERAVDACDTVTETSPRLSGDEYDALVRDAMRWRHHEEDQRRIQEKKAELPQAYHDAIKRRDRITAIRELRNHVGTSLQEAMWTVDAEIAKRGT